LGRQACTDQIEATRKLHTRAAVHHRSRTALPADRWCYMLLASAA